MPTLIVYRDAETGEIGALKVDDSGVPVTAAGSYKLVLGDLDGEAAVFRRVHWTDLSGNKKMAFGLFSDPAVDDGEHDGAYDLFIGGGSGLAWFRYYGMDANGNVPSVMKCLPLDDSLAPVGTVTDGVPVAPVFVALPPVMQKVASETIPGIGGSNIVDYSTYSAAAPWTRLAKWPRVTTAGDGANSETEYFNRELLPGVSNILAAALPTGLTASDSSAVKLQAVIEGMSWAAR